MAIKRVFLDTTILADIALKPGREGIVAANALKAFEERLIPQYAIKEFKAGILRNYIWLHTKAVTLDTYDDVMHALTRMWGRPNLTSTVLRALADFESSIANRIAADHWKNYPGESEGKIRKDELEIWLKTLIFRAWRKRKRLGAIVRSLDCYKEIDIRISDIGLIDEKPITCDVDDCCLRSQFSNRGNDINRMLQAFPLLPSKRETGRRKEVLDHLYRKPKRPLTEKQCRALGDAVFVLQCPKDAILLTTNLVDHGPLGAAIGVLVKSPSDI